MPLSNRHDLCAVLLRRRFHRWGPSEVFTRSAFTNGRRSAVQHQGQRANGNP